VFSVLKRTKPFITSSRGVASVVRSGTCFSSCWIFSHSTYALFSLGLVGGQSQAHPENMAKIL
jgi:hypothetical protein